MFYCLRDGAYLSPVRAPEETVIITQPADDEADEPPDSLFSNILSWVFWMLFDVGIAILVAGLAYAVLSRLIYLPF